MVICSCNVISDSDIRAAAEELVNRSPDTKLSALNLLAEMGCQPDCCGCVPQFKRIARETLIK